MLIQGNDLSALIADLGRRKVSLYHACQLLDFQSYLAFGGVPSRDLLERTNAYTPFDSDAQDKANGVWDKVFFNLNDFGGTFAQGRSKTDPPRHTSATPNPFGPILLVFDPEVLRNAADVAVCLRSAGSAGFSRTTEGVPVGRVADLFQEPPGKKGANWLRDLDQLTQSFGLPHKARQPEVSCTFPSGFAAMAHATALSVDPIEINGVPLLKRVRDLVTAGGTPAPQVRERMHVDRRPAYNELAQRVAHLTADELKQLEHGFNTHLDMIAKSPDASEELKGWAGACRGANLGWMFSRYCRYLRHGTMSR